MNDTPYQPGLNGRTSVGACGRYRRFAAHQQFRLPTMVWRDGIFSQPRGKTHFQLDLPGDYTLRTTAQDWTGRALTYSWNGGGVILEMRSTYPGARITALGDCIPIRWGDNLPDGLRDLETGDQWGLIDHPDFSACRFLVGRCRLMPVLIVLSQPLDRVVVTAHSHWEFRFRDPGGSMFIVPMLDAKDLPGTAAMRDIWQSLLTCPPRFCEESYRIDGLSMQIENVFPGAEYAPIPPMIAQAGNMRGLIELPDDRIHLMDSFVGPFTLAPGDHWQARIALDWTAAAARPTKAPAGDLAPIPEELVYPGDWSWEPESPLDKFLALRTWAPLVKLLPPDRRAELVRQLIPPDARAFRDSLHMISEPASGLEWAKERRLFEFKGDVSWDPDWYNGLTLSGLGRAVHSGIEEIAAPARALAAECRFERDAMLRYFEIFHDWSLWAAWTDARGLFWLPDCCHNGLEGILAESRLRREEGDADFADRLLYLAGKTAVSLMSLFALPTWCEKTNFILRGDVKESFLKPGQTGAETFGINCITDLEGVATITAETKNPYCVAGHFPEFSALLKLHGPVDRLHQLASAWAEQHPERYSDWVAFYIGADAEKIRRRRASLDQEAKEQASVFYHLAPEVCLRLWVLDEPGEAIEARFKTPLNLAEQLLLRSGMKLNLSESPKGNL